jgi:hypothetical protein
MAVHRRPLKHQSLDPSLVANGGVDNDLATHRVADQGYPLESRRVHPGNQSVGKLAVPESREVRDEDLIFPRQPYRGRHHIGTRHAEAVEQNDGERTGGD